ncbi:hypothetical protein [Tenacibaculum sp. 190524A05c]|uniref:hypothetical protein n=1 Tax=Tenacibaculum platacis TaxID=3137852 RepID=UPI0032B1586C
MNRFIIFTILFTIHSGLFSQKINPEKDALKKLFRESIKQDSSGSISTLSNPWIIDNTDNLFFKTDTVKLINIKDVTYKYEFCNFINWSFFKKDKFFQVESQTCTEPSSVKVSDEYSLHWVTIKQTELGLILNTYKSNGLKDRFLVLSINRNKKTDEIVLKRIDF